MAVHAPYGYEADDFWIPRTAPVRSHTPASHYSANEWGHFYIEGGELIGHLSTDVMLWAAAHPDYAGSIYFDYGNDEPQTEVRGEFYPDAEEADEALELARVA